MNKGKIGLYLVLILPVVGLVRFIISIIFYIVNLLGTGEFSQNIDILRDIVNWLLGIVALIGILGLIPGIILLIISKKKTIIKA